LKDGIYRDPEAEPSRGDPRYINAGELSILGFENALSYYYSYFTIHGNFTWQKALSAKDYGTRGQQIFNVPGIFGNLGTSVRPFYQVFPKLSIDLSSRYIGKQLSPIDTYKNGVIFTDKSNKVPPVFLFNTGARVKNFKHFSMSFSMQNIFNTRYYQGGTVQHPYPRKGRWFMIKIGYRFPFQDS
jgi:iron complex outermembrane receptor protein